MYFWIVSSSSIDTLHINSEDGEDVSSPLTRQSGTGSQSKGDNSNNYQKILTLPEDDDVFIDPLSGSSSDTKPKVNGAPQTNDTLLESGQEKTEIQTAAVKPFLNANENDQGRRHHGSAGGSRETTQRASPSLPGGGVDMTLSELQEMAARQQQQIESQQQILVAKEQRLKYLKQQEQKQQQLASENDRLRRLRDKVETQEMKLKKLRALRGQVEQQKASNGNLNYELESIKSLFNEKEKELAMAVAKVEEMTRQLEDIRSGRVKTNTNNQSPAAMAELEKLKKELMIRNKLNEQQSSKMANNRELLMKRKDELARMDNRIHELQARLKKKRARNPEGPEKVPVQANKSNINNNNKIHRPAPTIAAVEPYVQQSQTDDDPMKPGFEKKDPKYKSLPVNSKFAYQDRGSKPGETNNNSIDFNSKRYDSDKSEEYSIPLVVSVDSANKSMPNGIPSPKQSPVGRPVPGQTQVYPPVPTHTSSHTQPPAPTTSTSNSMMNNARFNSAGTGRSGMSHFMPRPFGSTYSTAIVPDRGSGGVPNEHPHVDLQEETRQAGSGQSSPGSVEGLQTGISKLSQQSGSALAKGSTKDVHPPSKGFPNEIHGQIKSEQADAGQHISKGPPVPSKPTSKPEMAPKHPPQNQNQSASKSAVSTNNSSDSSDTEQTCISVSKGIKKFTDMIANQNQPGTGGFTNLNHASALGAVRNVPTYRYASKSVIANTYLGKLDHEALEKYQKNVLSLHRDFDSNTKQSEFVNLPESRVGGQHTPANDEDKDSLSPLSSQSSSISTPSPASPQKSPNYSFDFPTTPPHADVASDKMSHKPNTPKNIRRRHSDSDNEEVGKALHKYNINTNNTTKQTPVQENQMLLMDNITGVVEIQATAFSDNIPETVLLDSKGNIVEVADTSKDNSNNNSQESLDKTPTVTIEVSSDTRTTVKKKSNLKSMTAKRHSNRVSFDPLALLLDASLEGELDLVRRCAHQVDNVSASNDEGITALHNAICAGHYEIVTFLVEFGCDVNSPDSDGWTPLHCAASCNNLPMVKFLVEHGACIFATTISDHETAAEKCEEDEDGYDGCSDYLYSIQEKLGIMNGGSVFAVFDYDGQNSDELDLNMGEKFTVLKKGDDVEKEWWWAKSGDKEGYIPRNLLGMTPRVLPKIQPNGDV